MPDTSVDYARDTALAIGNLPMPAAAMRGLTGELQPIDNGPLVEMLDFSLDDQTVPAGQLYEVTLTTSDISAPPLFGTFKGFVLTDVDFPAEVQEALALFPAGPTRTPVPGSLYYTDAEDSVEVPANDAPNRGAQPAAAFRVYRPRFARLMVTEPWKHSWDEYAQTHGMTLKARELPPEEQAA